MEDNESQDHQNPTKQRNISKMSTSKRKWAPKSKGGCHTCKSRHVRCDKTYPTCNPCQKSSRQCQYTSSPTPSTSTDPLKIVLYQPTTLVLHHSLNNPNQMSA